MKGLTCLKNMGNTCFVNSVLQCLVHIPELNEWLDTYNKDNLLVNEYNDLRKLMWQGHDGITPIRFIHVIHHVFPRFQRYAQQDAHELLLYILDELQCPLFEGKQISRLDTTNTEEKFISLEIPICGSTLDECMDSYLNTEMVSWNDKLVTKKLDIIVYPTILCITLKRFNNSNQKNESFIQIPLSYKEYELVGICNHYGRTQGGHYTATVLIDQWYEFNDERVTSTTTPITQSAYCLVFRKKTM